MGDVSGGYGSTSWIFIVVLFEISLDHQVLGHVSLSPSTSWLRPIVEYNIPSTILKLVASSRRLKLSNRVVSVGECLLINFGLTYILLITFSHHPILMTILGSLRNSWRQILKCRLTCSLARCQIVSFLIFTALCSTLTLNRPLIILTYRGLRCCYRGVILFAADYFWLIEFLWHIPPIENLCIRCILTLMIVHSLDILQINPVPGCWRGLLIWSETKPDVFLRRLTLVVFLP